MPSLRIANLQFENQLIQGPLAGFSCAPFRQLFYHFTPPAYCVSEMLSAHDVLCKHQPGGRYLYRAPNESVLCYQLSGNNADTISQAARKLEDSGADLIDLNCGCPKLKIRKKGAGSALLDNLAHLSSLIEAAKKVLTIPLTVKIRIAPQAGEQCDLTVADCIAQAGADALIVHGRSWQDDYDIACNYQRIKAIKQAVSIPVIANGDIKDSDSLAQAIALTGCDGFMISRAGSGRPWLYQQLSGKQLSIQDGLRLDCFYEHLECLAGLECEYQALLQSRRLLTYYFRQRLDNSAIQSLYSIETIKELFLSLKALLEATPAIDSENLSGNKIIIN